MYTAKFYLLFICSVTFAMQDSQMIQVHQAEDLVHFANEVVVFTPVSFIDDSHAYKEKSSQILNPALRYGYVSPAMGMDWSIYDTEHIEERGYLLEFLHTQKGSDNNVAILLTRFLKEDRLLMRKATSREVEYLLKILREKRAYFEIDCGCKEKHGSLQRIVDFKKAR